MDPTKTAIIQADQIDRLIQVLRAAGRRVVGPTITDGVMTYQDLTSAADLPVGWSDRQDGGSYRLVRRDDQALFAYSVGPDSWKKFLYPKKTRLWQANRINGQVTLVDEPELTESFAFLGVRSCELHAMEIQDKVFLSDEYRDPDYRHRREQSIVIAVNCGQAAATCFCESMATGPKVTEGFDLALTELIDDGPLRYLVEIGSEQGAVLLSQLETRLAVEMDDRAAGHALEAARQQMGRSMDTRGIKELLQDNPEHPRWDELATRCLSCANCTMVCPTCFCTTFHDNSDLPGNHAERWRHWDSCFTSDFSYVHGGSVRASGKSRYRQWLTHKLANWIDQFDSSGCVGCGRCITWCPVGIDLTEEVAAFQADRAMNEAKR
ncbi:MAG: 4Fe-4S dicluster domain-containing protein [Burkholderiaceae bacterium]